MDKTQQRRDGLVLLDFPALPYLYSEEEDG